MMNLSDQTADDGQDVENPTPAASASPPRPAAAANDPHRKWKILFYGTFLVAIIALSVTLGVILPRNHEASISNSPASSEGAANSNDVVTLVDPNEDKATTIESTDTVANTNGGSATETSGSSSAIISTPASSETTAAAADDSASTTSTTNSESTPPNASTQSLTTQFIQSNGPLDAKVRMIDPTAVNSYDSCDSLKDDIIEALKHFANSIITSEVTNDWWAKCDPNDPNWNPWGGNYYPQFPIAYESDAASMEMAAPEMGATASAGAAAKVEDSYGTNNQVEGVDEADIIKSDGKNVFAAYGDILYAWNATDGTKGTSITRMPYNETNCTDMPIIEPIIYDYENEGDAMMSSEPDSAKKARREEQNKRDTMSMPWYPPCYNPKPQILSLLLHDDRLTAIVSENDFAMPYSADSPSLINDHSSLTIRVYDVSDVPPDGGPLTLIGERKLHGNFNAARSIDNTGFVVTTSYVDTQVMANSLYRSQPLYCGLDNKEYEEKASLIALNRSDLFAEQLISELDLNYGCGQIFKISAMQSGNNTSDTANADLLSNFVSVISFNTADEYIDEEVPIALSGSFANGWLSNVYVAQNFVAALAVGSKYNPDTSSWDQSTFILGFDISNPTPVPYSVGQVSGSPINQYATDLFEDHLRIATTEWQWSETDGSRTTNKIFVLDLPSDPKSDATMKVVGETDHLGKPNESIYAVRFIGDTAYVVTFEQVDPFIVVDLTNATNPRPIGELELPGFSSYLHPIEIGDKKLMLGVGQDVNVTTGWTTGLKISLFDVTDPGNPVETASYVDQNAYSNAQYDFYSFRYLPLNQKLIIPQSEYTWGADGNFDGFIVYDITADDITRSHNISHASSFDMYVGCWYQAYMPPRSLVFQSKVTTILSHTVLSTDLDDGSLEWELNLDEGLNKTDCGSYFPYY